MKAITLWTALCFLILTGLHSPELNAQEKNPEYLIESTNLKELKKYKWKEVTKYFKEFDKKDIVSIRVKYQNNVSGAERKGQVDNFNIAVSGEARNAKALAEKMADFLDLLTAKF